MKGCHGERDNTTSTPFISAPLWIVERFWWMSAGRNPIGQELFLLWYSVSTQNLHVDSTHALVHFERALPKRGPTKGSVLGKAGVVSTEKPVKATYLFLSRQFTPLCCFISFL